MGIIIEDYLLATALSKSIPSSYDSTLRNLDEADLDCVSNSLEVRRKYRNEEVNLAT